MTTNELLFQIAQAESDHVGDENEAMRACLDLFKTVAACRRCARGDDPQFIDLSQPKESSLCE